MTTFKDLPENANIHDIIHDTFDADLPISGGWGYTLKDASIINSLPQGMPVLQLQHTITSIRAHLEMNITQEKQHRYAGINANERSRESIEDNDRTYDRVIYEVAAIQEDLYNAFIKEYKAGYESEAFDLNDHFKRRKEATLVREVVHFFEVSSL